jgi:hypothetical protein
MSEATDLVDRQIAAFRDRDLDRFLSFYAEDVKIRDFDGNVLMDGHEGMRGMYGPLFRDSPELSVANPSRIVSEAYVVDERTSAASTWPGSRPRCAPSWSTDCGTG